LFVGNLPYHATEEDVRAHFSAVAPPTRVAIPLDRETGRPRGFAFVEFEHAAQAQQAIQRFHGQPFMGRVLSVNEARAREDRGPAGRPPLARPGLGRPPVVSSGLSAAPDGAAAPQPAPRERSFGPPARKRSGPARRDRDEGRPRGPIPVRYTGRVYDVEAIDDEGDEPIDFDNFATSRPDADHPEGEGEDRD
jgi:RNA recognition motif-containing protein